MKSRESLAILLETSTILLSFQRRYLADCECMVAPWGVPEKADRARCLIGFALPTQTHRRGCSSHIELAPPSSPFKRRQRCRVRVAKRADLEVLDCWKRSSKSSEIPTESVGLRGSGWMSWDLWPRRRSLRMLQRGSDVVLYFDDPIEDLHYSE